MGAAVKGRGCAGGGEGEVRGIIIRLSTNWETVTSMASNASAMMAGMCGRGGVFSGLMQYVIVSPTSCRII